MNKKQQSYSFDFNEIAIFLYRNWKKLLIVSFSAALISYLVAGPWFIKPKFQSTAVFYPGTTNSIGYSLFYSVKQKAYDPLEFAEQEITEQYLELLKSTDLRGQVMKKFDLMNHYGIDPADPKADKKLESRYDKNIKCSRTEYNSIKIEVMDESPDKAAEIANGIMYTLDDMKYNIQSRVAGQIFNVVRNEYMNKLHEVDSIKIRLRELGALGVYDTENQAKGVAEATGNGHNSSAERQKLGEYGGEVTLLNEMLALEAENIVLLKTKHDQARLDMSHDISNVFVVSNAYPASDKAYPKRSIIVFIAALSAFVLACLVIVMREKLDSFKQMLNQ